MLAKAGKLPRGRRLGLRAEVGRDPGARPSSRAASGDAEPADGRTSPSAIPSSSRIAEAARRAATRSSTARWSRCDEEGRPRFQLIQRRMGLTSQGGRAAPPRDTPVDFIVFDLAPPRRALDPRAPLRGAPRAAGGLGLEGRCWQHAAPTGSRVAATCSRRRGRAGLEGVVAKKLDSPYRAGRAQRRVDQGAHLAPPGVRDRRLDPRRGQARRDGSARCWSATTTAREPAGRDAAAPLRRRRRLGAEAGRPRPSHRELKRRERPDSPFDARRARGPKAKLAVFCEPELVCEVSWSEWTDQGTLRQPAFKGMRDDKDPREVVREHRLRICWPLPAPGTTRYILPRERRGDSPPGPGQPPLQGGSSRARLRDRRLDLGQRCSAE